MHDKTLPQIPPPATVARAKPAVPRALRRYLSLVDFEPTVRRRLPAVIN
ncbi:MAG: hypothetical protein ACJ8FZ_25660 [Bradyrhizobium sp.]